MEDFDLEMIEDAQLDIVEEDQLDDPIMKYQDEVMDELARRAQL